MAEVRRKLSSLLSPSRDAYRRLILQAELSLLRHQLLRESRARAADGCEGTDYQLVSLLQARFLHVPLRLVGVLLLAGWILAVLLDFADPMWRPAFLVAGALLCWCGIRAAESIPPDY